MTSAHSHRAPAQSAAVFVRLAAFVVAITSVVVIPSTLAAAAAGHVSTPTAFAITTAAAGLSLITTLAARSLDPLRSPR